MAGGAYTALSGLRTRTEQLDRVAADLANVNTAGYKAERVTTLAAERPDFGSTLQSAIDVGAGPGRLDLRGGTLTATGRELDVAVEGPGFLMVETPAGPRLTRNGQFDRRSDGTMVTNDGMPVLGDNGAPIALGKGPVTVESDGTVRAGSVVAGKLKLVDVPDPENLRREDHGRFRYVGSADLAAPANTTVRGGAIEQSNVSVVERMVHLTEVGRNYEALQRGLKVLMNDVDLRAITEIGRR
jgi:flagellar basal body rod protein FlgG